jgi:hypothetical protein
VGIVFEPDVARGFGMRELEMVAEHAIKIFPANIF